MNLTPSQQNIKNRLYDKLQSLRFTKSSDNAKATEIMEDIILNIDQIVQGQLDSTGVRTELNAKSHNYMETK